MVFKKKTVLENRKFKKCKSSVYIFKTTTSGTRAASRTVLTSYTLSMVNNVSSVPTFK